VQIRLLYDRCLRALLLVNEHYLSSLAYSLKTSRLMRELSDAPMEGDAAPMASRGHRRNRPASAFVGRGGLFAEQASQRFDAGHC